MLRDWDGGCSEERGAHSSMLRGVKKVWLGVITVLEATWCVLLNSCLQRGDDADGRASDGDILAVVRQHSVLALDRPPTCPGGLLWLPWVDERAWIAGGLCLSLRVAAWCLVLLSAAVCS